MKGFQLQEIGKFFTGKITIIENLVHEAGADRLARMHRNNRATSVLMLEKMMTALHANDSETCFSKGKNDLTTSEAGQFCHMLTVIR